MTKIKRNIWCCNKAFTFACKSKAISCVSMCSVYILVFVLSFLQANNVLAQSFDTIQKQRPKIGLALSGGGAKGFAHIGVLKVLREAGIEPDYISGTSMGSIVGGFYAIGYSPQFIDSIVRHVEWTALLLDKLDRRYLSLDYRDYYEQQLLSIPIGKKRIKLPSGIKYGQNIGLLLSRYCSQQKSTDFSKFDTPFLCVGTNIVNGKSTFFELGYLNRAMRASMAIPTVFAPQGIGNKLFVDGGLVNNFPVKSLKDKGCDIIIGVDVQNHNPIVAQELDNVIKVLDRSACFYREALFDTAIKYVDYYINPDITGYSVSSFNDYDSLIVRGERAARPFLPQWKRLADSLKQYNSYRIKPKKVQPIDTIILNEMSIYGAKKLSYNWIQSYFPYQKGDTISLQALEENVKYLYGTLQFNTINYSVETLDNGTRNLFLFVDEADLGSLGLHLHYDTEYKAGLLVYSRYRNWLFPNTVTDLALGISENPSVNFNYRWQKMRWPSIVLNLKWKSFVYVDYLLGKRKIGEFRLSNLFTTLYLQKTINREWDFGVGLQFEVSGLRRNVGVEIGVQNDRFTHSFVNGVAYVEHNVWNHSYFPTKGVKWSLKASFVNEVFADALFHNEQLMLMMGEVEKATSLGKKWTLRSNFVGGISIGQAYYLGHMFYLGGQGARYLEGMVPFYGLSVGQLVGSQVLYAGFKLQYQLYKQHYLLAHVNAASMSYYLGNLLNPKRAAIGYGITYGYDSPIGPIEISLTGSNYKVFTPFVSIGYLQQLLYSPKVSFFPSGGYILIHFIGDIGM